MAPIGYITAPYAIYLNPTIVVITYNYFTAKNSILFFITTHNSLVHSSAHVRSAHKMRDNCALRTNRNEDPKNKNTVHNNR